MYQQRMFSIQEAASNLMVSEAFVDKFIKKGLITPINDGRAPKLTSYHYHRLLKAMELYESSYSYESIEAMLND